MLWYVRGVTCECLHGSGEMPWERRYGLVLPWQRHRSFDPAILEQLLHRVGEFAGAEALGQAGIADEPWRVLVADFAAADMVRCWLVRTSRASRKTWHASPHRISLASLSP